MAGLKLSEEGADDSKKNYAMLLADTVVTKADGAAPENATAAAPKNWKDVAYYLNVSRFSLPLRLAWVQWLAKISSPQCSFMKHPVILGLNFCYLLESINAGW